MESFESRGQTSRNAGQERFRILFLLRVVKRLVCSLLALLLGFDSFPILEHFGGVLGPLFSEDVGVPPYHLFVYFPNHVRNRKSGFLACDLRMKYNLQQEVAHFFREFGVIAAFERLQDFVCFLD